jgi:hypothetical protein
MLASSADLKGRDANLMLVLSDASGSASLIDPAGYITGYPLPESHYYALARTWAATEMPRPGCVWTHTILIDFADLALLDDPGGLASVFSRPGPDHPNQFYGKAIQIDVPKGTPIPYFDNLQAQILGQWIQALYVFPHKKILAAQTPIFKPEGLLFAIWAQQWPRLRRAFRFCTFSQADRSLDNLPFDFQIIPKYDRSARIRIADAIDVSDLETKQGPDMAFALQDLIELPSRDFRRFLRLAGGDIADGRSAFIPLCRIYNLLQEFTVRPGAIEDAVDVLEDSFSFEQARSARALVISSAAKQEESLSDVTVEFILRHSDLLDQSAIDVEQLGEALWKSNPVVFKGALADSANPGASFARSILAKLSVSALLNGLQRDPSLLHEVFKIQPEIVTQPSFWRLDDLICDEAFEVADKYQGSISAILEGLNLNSFRAAVAHFGAHKLLSYLFAYSSNRTKEWLRFFERDSYEIATVLSDGKPKKLIALADLARVSSPDFVPNVYGEDPWIIAIRNAEGQTGYEEELHLGAYLLARALGYRSNSPTDLIVRYFNQTNRALLESRLDDDSWGLISSRISRAISRHNHGRASQLQAAILEKIIDNNISAQEFFSLTDDKPTLEHLVSLGSETSRGRRFFRSIGQIAEEE